MLHKFHPLYNQDGTLSYFRVLCLIILALCMAGYAFLHGKGASGVEEEPAKVEHLSASDLSAAAETVLNGDPADGLKQAERGLKSIFSSEEKQKEAERLSHRRQALSELENGALFLSSCGNINAGFEGCRFEFSANVLQFYDASVNAADDGFSIVLKAKGEQLEDLCVEYGINSQGNVYAHDKKGQNQLSCLPESLREQKFTALHRITDDLLPNPAPSGAQPVITSSAATREDKGSTSKI